ncbi:hypothetical protein BC827DRAFT_653261 [Russula dissimulans]|nr:hypothetical protein BC827DRAFT_653261 [Russula dissimulans]
MASGPVRSLDHDIDLEAQEVDAQATVSDMQKALVEFLGTSEMHETSIPRSDATNDGGEAPTVTSEQTVNIETQPAISPAEGAASGSGIHETEINQSELHDRNRQSTGQAEQNETHEQTEAHHDPGPQNNPPVDGNPRGGGSDQEPEEKRMIGDFDGSANQLWTLYGKEAKSHDESRIRTLKEDMDGVLIFAGLFSASLTAFIIDSKQALKPTPSDEMNYYLQQNVEILSRISQQISTIAPQVSIPSTPPPPFPTTFSPSASDVRVNAFWFMSLVFSLSAALVAILVQQWVRDYMHVFQRYSDPLKSARLRQYLYEGSKGWYMPVVAESVPGLLHVSLFLFFLGLGDSVAGINITVGMTTIIPILICAVLYIFTTFAPALYPQSPYQTSFSVLIWYTIQKLRVRRYQDRDGEMKSVSANMAQGQMQLAMEETEGRTERDARAIRWLVHNLTEEAEMESLVVAIPGSFNVEWGTKVWKRVSEVIEDENGNTVKSEFVAGPPMGGNSSTAITPVGRSPRINLVRSVLGSILHPVNMRTEDQPITGTMVPLQALHPPDISRLSNQEDSIVRDLSMRIVPLLDKCKNRGLFASDEQWRRRTRGVSKP